MIYKFCKRCGKPLKNLESQVRGFGPMCWAKHEFETDVKKLFGGDTDAKEQQHNDI